MTVSVQTCLRPGSAGVSPASGVGNFPFGRYNGEKQVNETPAQPPAGETPAFQAHFPFIPCSAYADFLL